MNMEKLIIEIGLLLISGLLGFYTKQLERRIASMEKNNKQISDDLIRLESKLWSEEKLTNTIQNAVKMSLLDWENKFMKDYYESSKKRSKT